MKLKKLKLKNIDQIHPAAKDAFSSLECCNSLIIEHSSFSKESLLSLLKIRPVVLSKTKNKGYLLEAGFRQWLLAEAILADNTQIPCFVLSDNDEKVDKLAWADVYMSPYLFSIRPKNAAKQLSALAKMLPETISTELFSNLSNKQQISKATGLSLRSFNESKTKSQKTTFETLFEED